MKETTPKKSWFGRNWVWAVPVGGCLTIIVLFLILVGVLVFKGSDMIQDSKPVKVAMEKASKDEKVLETLGEPLEAVGIPSGSYQIHNGDANFHMKTKLGGPKGEGVLVVKGEREGGVWTYTEMYIEVLGTEKRIDLLEADQY